MIVIVSDSYACQWGFAHGTQPVYKGWQHYIKNPARRSWVTEVAKYCNDQIDVHGYGGQSWWYSWYQFNKVWKDKLDQIDCMVFCHTDPGRINNGWNHDLIKHRPEYDKSKDNDESVLARELFFKYIHDDEFNIFAQQSYFAMLAKMFSHIKTIHFFTSKPVVGIDQLPGMVFKTPLIQLSIAGATGTRQQILEKINDIIDPDSHANHLNMANNVALGKLVIDSIENYQPGMYEIDFSKFEVVNPNYTAWPNGNWAYIK